MTRHDKPLAPDRIAAVTDEKVDFGDIPELDEPFWREAELVVRHPTGRVAVRVSRPARQRAG